MNPTEERETTPVGTIIGRCVLAAGITQIPGIVAGLLTAQILPRAGLVLLLLTLPSGLMLFLGGLGLIWRQPAGYYLVYLATFFGGIGGFKSPYVPFIKRFVNIGPATEDLFLPLNLGLVAMLVWEHWKRITTFRLPRQNVHRVALITLVVLGLGSVSIGRAMIHRERGEKNSAADLPVVGPCFSDFNTTGTLRYFSVETKIPNGITLVFSGTANDAPIETMAKSHQLKKMDDPKAQKKFLPQAKAWRLDEPESPRTFSPDDWYYVGRLKDMRSAILEVVYRRPDGRFTAQIFGLVPR